MYYQHEGLVLRGVFIALWEFYDKVVRKKWQWKFSAFVLISERLSSSLHQMKLLSNGFLKLVLMMRSLGGLVKKKTWVRDVLNCESEKNELTSGRFYVVKSFQISFKAEWEGTTITETLNKNITSTYAIYKIKLRISTQ